MITIRRAVPADAVQLQRISEGAAAYGGTLQLPYSSVDFWAERLRQSSGDDIVLVAVDGDEIVGSAGLHPEKKASPPACGHAGYYRCGKSYRTWHR